MCMYILMRQSNVKDFHSQLYIKYKVYSYMGNGSAVYLIVWVLIVISQNKPYA